MRSGYERKRPDSERKPVLAVFDTEGTTLDVENPYAVLYSWDFLVCDGDPGDVTRESVGFLCHHEEGRDVASLYAQIVDMVGSAVEGGFYWAVGVHNLTYDAAYLRHLMVHCGELGWTCAVTARSSTKLLTIAFRKGRTKTLVFFDTLALFGCSLRKLGDNLGFEKLHIDYAEDLSPETALSPDNVAYNRRDTEVLMVAICRSLLTRDAVALEDLGSRVLTKTSIVRKADRESKVIGALPVSLRKSRGTGARKTRVTKTQTVYDADRYTVGRHQYTDMESLKSWASYGSSLTSDVKGFFAGGVNVSNSNLAGVALRDVVSYDLKSAYPAIMLSYRIPSRPRKVSNLNEYSHLLEPELPDPVDVMTCRTGFWFGTVVFENVSMDDDWRSRVGDSTLTQSMVLQNAKSSSNLVFEDGFLVRAATLVLTLSTPEFYEMCLQYVWDSARFTELTVYDGKEFPTWYSVLRTVHHYREKSVAKQVQKTFAEGATLDSAEVESWLDLGYVTYDEAEALRHGACDEAWVEAFVMAHKGNLNALYGIMVTDPLKDDYVLDSCGYLEKDDVDAWDSYVDCSRDSGMWREAGVCVALFNRYKIAYMARLVVESGYDVAYIDTDSIKVPGGDKAVLDTVFASLHDRIEAATFDVLDRVYTSVACRVAKLQAEGVECTMPVYPSEEGFHELGKLDYEGTYPEFVTTGHKRYAYTERAGEPWRYKSSGYALGVLHALGRQLEECGMHSLAPLLVIGYDVRFDSSTGIASVQTGIDDTWVDVEFEALDRQGSGRRVLYRGSTCPGYAIMDAGKVMNDTSASVTGRQRFEAACRNNPAVAALARTDVRCDNGVFSFGPRGTVPMDWGDWELDYTTGTEVQD